MAVSAMGRHGSVSDGGGDMAAVLAQQDCLLQVSLPGESYKAESLFGA